MASPTTNPPDRQWLKITFSCPLPLLEPVADLMGVLSGVGVEQSPETASGALVSGFFQLGETDSDPQGQVETVEAILARVTQQMTELFSLYECVPEKPVHTLLADQDWATSWQQYFKPFEIVPGLVIKPSWETYPPGPGQHILELDPGMAFGTGQHASTQMALALLQMSIQETSPAQALDVGTGTGILAMAAALFGVAQVIAIDNDPDAVVVAGENIANNRLEGQIEVSTTPVTQITGAYQLVCANIVHDVLVEMAPTLTGLTAVGGQLVLAGILSGEQENNIINVYQEQGCQLLDRRYQEEWVALRLQRADNN
ncbi:MAG: 50S ribosomal protein L11 methyltransferase [Desulfobulbaceae bacterium]|nr:50S ribosomal protein L11 methyltransferase [Desulfobulbaceae bacterium]